MAAGAYFLTWTTYGSWLPGDPRGSAAKGQNTPGTPYAAHDPRAIEAARRAMPGEPVLLGASERGVVERAIRAHCELRGWLLHAINVRSNHVHVVLTAPVTPERCMAQFKSWSTRRLREAA